MIQIPHRLAFIAAGLALATGAHAGLLGQGGGSGALGVGLGPTAGTFQGSAGGQGALQAPSPRPLVDRAQSQAGAARDAAVQKAGTVKDAAAEKAAALPGARVDAGANTSGQAGGSVQR